MTAVVIVLAYLLGSIPSGIWIGKYFYHTDIRTYGSGNSGTTNTFRVLGKKAGTIVLIMDMLKGSAATLLPIWLGAEIHPLLAGVVAALGHTYPLFAGFKGGKAVATSGGIILAYNPLFSQKPSSLSSSIFIFPEWSAYPAYWSVLRQCSFPSFLRIGR